MYRYQKKSFVKIRAPLASPFLCAKNLGGPLGTKKIVFKFVFIEFKTTGYATRFQQSKRLINPSLWGLDILQNVRELS